MNFPKSLCLRILFILFSFGISEASHAQSSVPEVVATRISEIFKRDQGSDVKNAKVYYRFLTKRKDVDKVTVLDLGFYLEHQKEKIDYIFLSRLLAEYTSFEDLKTFFEKSYYLNRDSNVSEVKKLFFLLKVLDTTGKVGQQTEYLLGRSVAIQQTDVCKALSKSFETPKNLNQFNLLDYCLNLSGETDKAIQLFKKYRNSSFLIKTSKNNLRLNEAYALLFMGNLAKAAEVRNEISRSYLGYETLSEDIELAKGEFSKIFSEKTIVSSVNKKNFYEAVRFNGLQKILNQPKAEVLYKNIVSFANSPEYVLKEIYSSQLNILLYALAVGHDDTKFASMLVDSYEWRKKEGHKNQLETAFFEPILKQVLGTIKNVRQTLAPFGGKGHPDLIMASKILIQHENESTKK